MLEHSNLSFSKNYLFRFRGKYFGYYTFCSTHVYCVLCSPKPCQETDIGVIVSILRELQELMTDRHLMWMCVCVRASVVSDSLQHHGQQPARFQTLRIKCLRFLSRGTCDYIQIGPGKISLRMSRIPIKGDFMGWLFRDQKFEINIKKEIWFGLFVIHIND